MYRGLAEVAGWGRRRIEDGCRKVVVDFPAEETRCPRCGEALGVLKSSRRDVVTLEGGEISAREIQRVCRACGIVARSRELSEMVPRGQRYGYDLIVWVGLRRWMDGLQRLEARDELEKRYGIRLSAGTITALADRFLAYFGALHQQATPKLKREMRRGYALHIDATTYQGRGGLFICYDGCRRWVLHSGRIEGERTEEIRPIVEETVAWFEEPIAVMRDQSKACKAAVEPLASAGVPDLVCHYHVLKNLGRRLLILRYRRFKNRWERRLKVGAALDELLHGLRHGATNAHQRLAAAVLWVIHGDSAASLSFPFRLPALERFDRLLALQDQLAAFIDLRRSGAVAEELETLKRIVSIVAGDADLAVLQAEIRQRQHLFNELRSVFRMADPSNGQQPPLPALQHQQIRDIEEDVSTYRSILRDRFDQATGDHRAAVKTVLSALDRVKGRLFGHPVIRDTEGKPTFVVDRTNNAIEHLFSRQNQAMRRQTGRKNLGRDLDDLPAEAALVHNLARDSYVSTVLGSLDQLPARFAALEPLPGPLRPRPLRPLLRCIKAARSQLTEPRRESRPQRNPATATRS